MDSFFAGTIVNRFDKKLRVSVPASFRQILALEGANSVFLRPSPIHEALEGYPPSEMNRLWAQIDALDPEDEEADALAVTRFAESVQVAWDPEGRIGIPDALRAHAKLGEDVLFAGLGKRFQIWEPGAYQVHRARMIEKARNKKRGGGPA